MRNNVKVILKNLAYDLVFIIVGFICLHFFNEYSSNPNGPGFPNVMLAAVTTAIIIIYLFPIRFKEDKPIYENKKAIIVFLILEAFLQILIFTLNTVLGLNNSTSQSVNGIYYLLIYVGLSLTLFICYFFNIKFKDFNWNISAKSIILVITVYLGYQLCFSFIDISRGTIQINNILNIKSILKFIKSILICSAYPGLYEEVLYRGFLISGLKGLGLNDNNCNIIQSILFGINHTMSWGIPSSLICLLAFASQAMGGYILGKVYFKTKSLLPCILLHGLFDAL